MQRIDEPVPVLISESGVPVSFRWREVSYLISSKPTRWFARSEWWIGERAHRGIGSGALEVEMWRFLALGECGTANQFELLHNTVANSWKLVRRFDES